MRIFSDILSSGVVSNLGSHPALKGGVQSLLTDSAYVPTANPNGSGLILNQVLSEEFVKRLTYDFERFALASRESFLVAMTERNQFSSLGWPLLKLYYASFFAAHAIMRSRGVGIIKIDRKQIDTLNEVAKIYDPSAKALSSGMFFFKRSHGKNNSINEISLEIKPDLVSGGVHESFWINFCKFISEEAERSVSNGDIYSSSFVALSGELSDAVLSNRNAKGVWLSSIRNEINYQHKYDTWHPYKRSSEGYKALNSALQSAIYSGRLDVSKEKKPIEAFLNVTCYISAAAFTMCNSIALRSTRGGAFGQKWRKLNLLLETEAEILKNKA